MAAHDDWAVESWEKQRNGGLKGMQRGEDVIANDRLDAGGSHCGAGALEIKPASCSWLSITPGDARSASGMLWTSRSTPFIRNVCFH